MELSEAWRKVERGTVRPLAANGGDRNSFLARRRADRNLVTYRKTLCSADVDPGRAGVRRGGEICLTRRCADMRHGHGFDSMSDTVDIQPDLVTDRNIGVGCYFDVARSGMRVHREIGLCARLADCRHLGHLVLLHGICDDGVGSAVPERDLLANNEAGHALHRHIGRARM